MMPFDPTTARPITPFNPTTAQPVTPTQSIELQSAQRKRIAENTVSPEQLSPTQPPDRTQGFLERMFKSVPQHAVNDYKGEVKGDIQGMKSGAAQVSAAVKGAPGQTGMQRLKEGAKGVGRAAMSGMDYVFSPVNAAIHQVAGRPVEEGAKLLGAKPETAAKFGGYADFTASLFAGKPTAPGKTVATAAEKATDAAAKASKPVTDEIEKIFSPTTVSESAGRSEALRRTELGEAARATAQTGHALNQYAADINKLPVEQQRELIGYMETRTKGKKLPEAMAHLQPVADHIREVMENRRAQIEALDPETKRSFVADYYPHMWKEKQVPNLDVAPRPPKQGSGRNLKQRTIPTIEDGLKAGLTPVNENPIETTLTYVANMDKFLAENRIIKQARKMGDVKYFTPGRQPQGWVELNGRLANKTALLPAKGERAAQARPMKAYAPEDWARVYNNAISPGVYGSETFGKTYDVAQKIVNSATMMELGLSGFHAYTMAQEAAVDGLTRAIGKAVTGDLKGAAKGAASSMAQAPEPFHLYKLGQKVEDAYLGVGEHSPDFKKIVDLGTKANMKMAGGRADWMRGSARKNFYDSWKKGSLRSEMMADVKGMKERPIVGTAKAVSSNVARVMDTVAMPLFDKMIPRLKNGAFYENMGDWLKAHPSASHEEQMKAARQIVDSIDNRFGEMNMDNVFWNKTMKQVLQLLIRAPGWDIGTLRELGGGVSDAFKGNSLREMSPRTKYIIALPVITMMGNEAWSYLKTGKPTADPFTYPTGGRNPDGTPEKAMVPGYMRDVFGYLHDVPGSIVDETGAKVATVPRLAAELLTNKDYRDMPISELSKWAQQRGAPGPLMSYLDQVWRAYEPLSMKTWGQRKTGTNISPAETVLGIRPAPMYMSEPTQYNAMIDAKRKRGDMAKERSDTRMKNRRVTP